MGSSRETSPGVRSTGRSTLAFHSARISSARCTVAWLTFASRARSPCAEVVRPDALAAVADRLGSGQHTEQDREAIFTIVLDAALRAFAWSARILAGVCGACGGSGAKSDGTVCDVRGGSGRIHCRARPPYARTVPAISCGSSGTRSARRPSMCTVLSPTGTEYRRSQPCTSR